MALLKDIEDVAKFLKCSSILEQKVANTYQHLSERVENHQIKSLLSYISRDSAKHAAILKDMSESNMKLDVTADDCEQVWGKAWKDQTMQSMEELTKKETITNEDLTPLIGEMKNLEGVIGENYLTILHVGVLKLVAQQYHIDLGSFNTILEWIVEDEERHETILAKIKTFITK